MRLSALFALLLCLVPASPVRARTGEGILDYHSDITVHEDASMTVRETIRVQAAGDRIKRGIYRDFPTRYQDRTGRRHVVDFDLLGVERDGRPEPHHTESRPNGVRVYIGQKNVYLRPGEYTYTLTYRTDWQLGFFDDHDELYWNVTGTGWDFPIREASATVHLPDVPREEIGPLKAWTGPKGAEGGAYEAETGEAGAVHFRTTTPLGREEGLTIAVAWPKGYVNEPTEAEKWKHDVLSNLGPLVGLVGTFLVVIYYLIVWFNVGIDPEAGVIVPLYEPPQDCSPAVARFVREMGYDNRTFAAAVISMAVKGYLSIEEDEDGTYTLRRGEAPAGVLSKEEKKIAGKLLGRREEVVIEQDNHSRISKAINAAKTSLGLTCEKKYFLTNKRYFIPGAVISVATVLLMGLFYSPLATAFLGAWLSIWSIGVFALLSAAVAAWRSAVRGPQHITSGGGALFLTLFSIPFVAGEIFGIFALSMMTSVLVPVVILLLAGINLLFYHLIKAPTLIGRQLLDKIEGFRMFLAATEGDSMAVMHGPERTVELYERYLPYALALDVEQEWSEQFSEVLRRASQSPNGYSPVWYSGSSWSSARAGAFAGGLAGSFGSAIASSSTAPGSSSGFSGGGSSGGGGGGGGGGGW
ncbi:MAG: DUF2207 domain-containing protein [Candidatus Brocadiia bacterium]